MATVTHEICTCDVCGDTNDVRTWAFGLDGKRYEIDLCRDDRNGLSKVAAGYIPKARKVKPRQRQRQKAKVRRTKEKSAGSKQAARASRTQPPKTKAAQKQAAGTGRTQPPRTKAAPKQAAKSGGIQQEKGVYVYGILPADVEVAAEVLGVGEHPGPLGVVRSNGLAALISEVGPPERLRSPEDLRTHREILDTTAIEVPVLPLRFGTVLTGEDAVADELLAPHHDEFAAALEQLEGRVEFVVKGRYIREAIPGEVSAEDEQAAQLRQEDTRALGQAMEEVCVASVVKKPTHELDAVHIAFLVAVDKEREVERVIEDLSREWEGRIEVRLLGPMAAYDFVRTDSN